MLIVNGEGYDSLIDSYERGEISKRTQILVGFRKKGFFDNYVPIGNSIVFNKKGVLCFEDKGKIGKPLNLEDLTRIEKWGAAVSKDYLKEHPIRA